VALINGAGATTSTAIDAGARKVVLADGLDGRSNKPKTTEPQALRADLIGRNACSANGITATGHAPVLGLCRQLLAAGLDPDRALEVYRGSTLALRVRSIGEAAGLEINSKGTGFVPLRGAHGSAHASKRVSPTRGPTGAFFASTDGGDR
jgi:hypothetical protein